MAVDFGKDTSCTTGLRTGRLVTGPRLVAEATFRRVTTRRGMLRGGREERSYGVDLREYVGTTADRATAAALEGIVRAEVEQDERLLRAEVSVTSARVGPATHLAVTIAGYTAAGPFRLVLGVSEVTVDLLGLTVGSA